MANQTGIAFLEALKNRGSILGLSNMEALMAALNHPEDNLNIIHVAGTNGKGSVCSYMANILQVVGYKVGSFNSPHLIVVNECIRINDVEIEDAQLEEIIKRMYPILEQLEKYGVYPTYFEVLVAIMFTYFSDQHVDYVLLEVGLGGRNDATNVIKSPLLSVITSISIDHIDILGDNIADIAQEKSGIIKEGRPVVALQQPKEAVGVIEKACKTCHSDLTVVDTYNISHVKVSREGTLFTYNNQDYKLQMIGSYQADNAIIAIEAMRQLPLTLTEDVINKGLYQTKWYGRFERIGTYPDIYIDGAHNMAGVTGLKDTLAQLDYKRYIGIIGLLRDKEVDKILECIIPSFDVLIVTEPENMRAMQGKVLYDKISSYGIDVIMAKDIEDAKYLALGCIKNKQEEAIIGFGSLYMIGELMDRLPI